MMPDDLSSLEKIYNDAVWFVDNKFDGKNLRTNERRITILSLMKQIIELKKLYKEIYGK